MNQKTFTQHIIDNPQIFCRNDSHFICSYHKTEFGKFNIQLDDTYLVDEDGKYFKIYPKHWIMNIMDKHVKNRKDAFKYSWLKFDYETMKLTFIDKPDDELFISEEERKKYVKYSKKEVLE